LRRNGVQAFQQGDYDSAIDAWERVEQQIPEMTPREPLAEAYFRRALQRAYGEIPDEDAASHDLEHAVALQPDETRYRYHLGLLAQRQGDLAAAIEAYQAVVQGDGEFAQRATYPLALAWSQQGRDPTELPVWGQLTAEEQAMLQEADAFRRRPYNVSEDAPPLWQGIAALDKGEEETPVHLNHVLQDTPSPREKALAHYYLGVWAAQREDWETTRKHWMAAASEGLERDYFDFNLGEFYHRLAEERLEDDDVEGALMAAQEAARHRDVNSLQALLSQVYQRRGYQAASEGQWSEAHDHWQKAYDFEDGSFRQAYNMALAYERAENFLAAGETWREVLRRRPRLEDHPDAISDEEVARLWARAAEAYTKAGEYDEAVNVYKTAVKYNPDHLETRLMMVDGLMVNGRLQAAENELDRILERDSDYIPALLRLGEVRSEYYGWWWQTNAITKPWERVLELEPDNTQARQALVDFHLNRGDESMQWGNYIGALDAYEKALEFDPDNGLVWAVIAGCFLWMGEDEEAEVYLEGALERGAENLDVYNHIIHIWLSLDEPERAWDVMHKAETQIADIPFQFYLSQVMYCVDAGLTHLMPPWITRAQEMAPPEAPVLMMISEALVMGGAFELAREYLDRVLAEDQPPGQAYLLLGIVEARAGNQAEARRHWQRAERIARKTHDDAMAERVQMTREIFSVPPELLDMLLSGRLPMGPEGLDGFPFPDFLNAENSAEEFEDDDDFDPFGF
jgi:tetratricopeptide (TPR) repeat protein